MALVPFKNAEDIGTDFLNYWRIWELMCPPQSRPSTISYQEQQQLRLGAAQKNFPRRVILNTNCKQPLACTA